MEKNAFKYSYKSSTQENISLSVYNVGFQRCEPEHTWGPGIRDHYLLHYVKEGKGFLKTSDGTLKISAGSLFLIRPSELVTYTADKDSPWEYYWVGFNGTEAHRLINLTPFASKERIFKTDEAKLPNLLMQIYDSRGNSSAHETKMLGFLYQFLGILMEKSKKKPPKKIHTKLYIEQATKFISYNFSSDITIEDVAKAAKISPSHLYRIFSSEFNMSPTQFLMRYRINEACSLLKTENLSVAEVAASVGFSDQFYFSRVFKKVKGVSPRGYLKK